jgi:hypothetical protein
VLDLFVHVAFAQGLDEQPVLDAGRAGADGNHGQMPACYGPDFMPPRALSRLNAERMMQAGHGHSASAVPP